MICTRAANPPMKGRESFPPTSTPGIEKMEMVARLAVPIFLITLLQAN